MQSLSVAVCCSHYVLQCAAVTCTQCCRVAMQSLRVAVCCSRMHPVLPCVAVPCGTQHVSCLWGRDKAHCGARQCILLFAHPQETCCVTHITITHGNPGYIWLQHTATQKHIAQLADWSCVTRLIHMIHMCHTTDWHVMECEWGVWYIKTRVLVYRLLFLSVGWR